MRSCAPRPANPKGDVWWGGTGDPHLQAAEEGLTEEYDSPMRGELHDWAIKQAEAAGNKTVGVYSGALGFGYNKDLLAKNNLPEPKCWADLTKPEYKGQIQIANPNSSGTAYTMLATMVQLMGEDKGFEYLKALHKNVNQYTKSGSAPIKAAGLGETTIGIVFMHDAVAQTAAGFPIVTGRALRGHRLRDRLDVDHQGRPQPGSGQEILRLGADGRHAVARRKDAKSFQVPSNKAASRPTLAPDLSTIKLIDYDFKKYGSSDERKRLLTKWDDGGLDRCRSDAMRLRAKPSAPLASDRRPLDGGRAGSALPCCPGTGCDRQFLHAVLAVRRLSARRATSRRRCSWSLQGREALAGAARRPAAGAAAAVGPARRPIRCSAGC